MLWRFEAVRQESSCHGLVNKTANERLDDLELNRDTACAAAEGYARRARWKLDIENLADDLKTAKTANDIDAEAYLCGEEHLSAQTILPALVMRMR
jgi:hypothetical protein